MEEVGQGEQSRVEVGRAELHGAVNQRASLRAVSDGGDGKGWRGGGWTPLSPELWRLRTPAELS